MLTASTAIDMDAVGRNIDAGDTATGVNIMLRTWLC